MIFKEQKLFDFKEFCYKIESAVQAVKPMIATRIEATFATNKGGFVEHQVYSKGDISKLLRSIKKVTFLNCVDTPRARAIS